jgi:hypothetical protein
LLELGAHFPAIRVQEGRIHNQGIQTVKGDAAFAQRRAGGGAVQERKLKLGSISRRDRQRPDQQGKNEDKWPSHPMTSDVYVIHVSAMNATNQFRTGELENNDQVSLPDLSGVSRI